MNAEPDGAAGSVRTRTWLFGVWIITTLVVGAAGLLFGHYQRQSALRSSARAVAKLHFVRHHWKQLESLTEFRPVIEGLARGFALPNEEPEWTAKFISVAMQRTQDLDEFDTAALQQIRSGADEILHESFGGNFRYAVAVRVGSDCLGCHVRTVNGPTKVGDLIAVVRVERAAEETTHGPTVARNTSIGSN